MGRDKGKTVLGGHNEGTAARLFRPISQKSNPVVRQLGPEDMTLMTVDGVFTDEEARLWVQSAESSGLFQHQGSGGAAKGEAFRDNDRFAIQSSELAGHLWEATGLSKIMRSAQIGGMHAVGLNPNLRFYRYKPGQKFGKHVDDSVAIPGLGTSAYTLLIYLSGQMTSSPDKRRALGLHDVLVGGETIFYGVKGKRAVKVVPKPGLALLHLHGEDCLEHEAAEVKQGIKYVLRSDVIFA